MFYISFHGGSSGRNNIHRYDDQLSPQSDTAILPPHPKRDELRGFVFRGNMLYVVNAHVSLSQVLLYQTDGSGTYASVADGIFASKATVDSISHPFQLAFDEEGNSYLSSQDTNLVTQLDAAGSGPHIAPFLLANYPPGTFLAGTWVASSVGQLPETPPQVPVPPNVAPPQGLEVQLNGSKTTVEHSVRGVAIYGSALFVADEPGDAVKVYDLASGQLTAEISGQGLNAPVHLLVHDGLLYIGSTGNDSIYTCSLAGGPLSGTVAPTVFVNGDVKHPSGMTFDDQGTFYVAERKAQKVFSFDSEGKNKTEIGGELPDEPEFIVWRTV